MRIHFFIAHFIYIHVHINSNTHTHTHEERALTIKTQFMAIDLFNSCIFYEKNWRMADKCNENIVPYAANSGQQIN